MIETKGNRLYTKKGKNTDILPTRLVRLVRDLPEAGLRKGLVGSVRGGNDQQLRIEFNVSGNSSTLHLIDRNQIEEIRLADMAKAFPGTMKTANECPFGEEESFDWRSAGHDS